MFKIGIDLGGTKIEAIILDDSLKEILRKRINTEQEKGYEHILDNIASLYKECSKAINEAPHTFGIGTPGSVSAKTGMLKNSNTVCLNGKPFLHDLEKRIGRKVAIENDANCFAMAEALNGAGRGQPMVFGVIMGTGCGGGIVYNGQVIQGLQSIAGEWGHTTIDYQRGPKCYCGKHGCVETFISGGGVEKRYEELTGDKKSLHEIILLYRSGNENAGIIMHNFFEHFGVALSNVLAVIDPDIVVLGGGVSNIEELYTLGIEQVRKYHFNDELKTQIIKNQTGDSAGVIGAALIGI
ncbi:MAG: ROK family protein [Sporocytophaga sp.]|uniref:ROK family protein n=1 Tax=Sporocytophaga sp. TaxID=2231183 RepID=UPI001B196438|nr:ROK family protein [Sporocytophaga sp.]MBO9703867.1 ROK family protein [Sporocytophaga sp.]